MNSNTVKVFTKASMDNFRHKIVLWHHRHKRSYPWRTTKDPFRVLIAEMMLRRTKADQVKGVYKRLFNEFPNLNSLAIANNRRLFKILYPLGLKWRMPSFRSVAREIKDRYRGEVPAIREELKTLPGVGDYVAGAVLSIAFKKKEWIVDSNVVRVFKRYFGIRTSIEGRRDRHVIGMAKRYILYKNPRRANLALLDFTSLICKPRDPECGICPIIKTCFFGLRLRSKKI